jgi:cell division protein FtsW
MPAAARTLDSSRDAWSTALPGRPLVAYDVLILFLVGLLMMLGVVMVYSASVTIDGAAFDWRRWWESPLRQCVFAGIGFLGMLFAAHLDYRFFVWERRADGWWAGGLALAAAVLLMLVLVPGIGAARLGAQRAIVVFSHPFLLSFQPSELAKLTLVIWLAAWLARDADVGRPGSPLVRDAVRGYLPAIGSAGLLIGLTGIEDFGTAALMGAVTVAMLFLAGARFWHLGLTVLAGGLCGAGLILLKSYRSARLSSFFSDNPDPAGEGYQIAQSLIAIGSGGWWGRGLGAGVQKYGYLPQDNNDFVLAILCEELGIAAGIAVCLLFLLLLWRGWWIARRADQPFGRLLAAGITLTFCLQAAFNIGVVTHSIPTKGISLPFVSAGGSGVVFLGLAAGLLASVGGRRAMEGGCRRLIGDAS